MTSAFPESARPPHVKPTIYPQYCHHLSPTINKWVPLSIKDIGKLEEVDVWHEGRQIHHLNNHPIKWVKVTAVVVAIDTITPSEKDRKQANKEKKEPKVKKLYTLDDGSGACIECSALAAPEHVQQETAQQRHFEQLAKIRAQEDDKGKGQKEENGKKEEPSVDNPTVPWKDIDIGSVLKIKGKIGIRWNNFQVEAIKIEVLRGLDAEVKAWNEVGELRRTVLDKPWVLTREEEGKCERKWKREMARSAKGQAGLPQRTKDERNSGKLGNHGRRAEVKNEPGRRKDLERVQKIDGVKRRKEVDEAQKKKDARARAEALQAAIRASAGTLDALGI